MAAISAQKPPIAPKSEAVRQLARKRLTNAQLKIKYVHQMKLRFEGFSHSTGNVNHVSLNLLEFSVQNTLKFVLKTGIYYCPDI